MKLILSKFMHAFSCLKQSCYLQGDVYVYTLMNPLSSLGFLLFQFPLNPTKSDIGAIVLISKHFDFRYLIFTTNE